MTQIYPSSIFEKIGIGTSTPVYPLDVAGTVKATGLSIVGLSTLNSGGYISSFNSTWTESNPGNGAFQWNITGSVPNAGVIGALANIYNNGPNSAQGQKTTYFSSANISTGLDSAQVLIGVYNPAATANYQVNDQLVRWTVGITPNETTHKWTHIVEEYNVVNRGRDMGWRAYRNDEAHYGTGAQQITGIVNYSLEATGLGQPGEGKNALFAELFGQSQANTPSTGIPARFYNASMYEPNCVVGGSGRAIYINGDLTTDAAQIPYAPLEVNLTWLHGLRTTTATFQDGAAFTMAPGQAIAWDSGTSVASIKTTGAGLNQNLILTPTGSGKVGIGTTSPAYSLDVVGTIQATSIISTNAISSLYGGTGIAAATFSAAMNTWFKSLPTALPSTANQPWNNGGSLSFT